MKKTTRTLTKEYDLNGKLIKETETTVEEEYTDTVYYKYPNITYPTYTTAIPCTTTTSSNVTTYL